MQYWINHNGVQSGPVDIDGLKEMALTSRAYVWHEGMTDWVKITELPELQGLYEMAPEDASAAATQAATAPEQIPAAAESHAEAAPEAREDACPPREAVTGRPCQPLPPAQPAGSPYQQPYPYPAAQPQASGAPVQPKPKSPPTNLVWAIISTLMCCLPAGVVAIIYSVKVMNKYNAGDIEGAERASEVSAWWCIASIVLGIISMPLAYLVPLLGQ